MSDREDGPQSGHSAHSPSTPDPRRSAAAVLVKSLTSSDATLAADARGKRHRPLFFGRPRLTAAASPISASTAPADRHAKGVPWPDPPIAS
ncbi:hypothetical protein L3Q65_08350 [Amycolatopsis sp. FU40]|uniref:hypothetical protein n=1 Tax=Amycolatopsis sp. FU40 TaxID=2914159 RepID=UPI001F36E121|nr:hypothetical protein [Amycolatopsis sp. FU40]UKD56717.1 hypothetical protein L3Q65_08350 [Amycolatopsis sp. FU40]